MNIISPLFILDLGSRSAKLYQREFGGNLNLIHTENWELLEIDPSFQNLQRKICATLEHLIEFRRNNESILAVGTEAMRRNPQIRKIVESECNRLAIPYRTLSQAEEAQLIQSAVFHHEATLLATPNTGLIANVGGGSLQLVHTQTVELIPFGISDLNLKFHLNKSCRERQWDTAVEWIQNQIPKMGNFLTYTGGEKTYLLKLGVTLDSSGNCSKERFLKLAHDMLSWDQNKLEELSPFGPKWMNGAISSNAVLSALLIRNNLSHFYPSDLNIGHGLICELEP